MYDTFNQLTARLQYLEDENKHLKACSKEATLIQNRILDVGGDLLNLPRGTTYTVDMAWEAIINQLNNGKPAVQ